MYVTVKYLNNMNFAPKTLFFTAGGAYEIWAGYSLDFCKNLRRVNELRVNVT